MRIKMFVFSLFLVIGTGFSGSAMAETKATADECVAKCKEGAQMVNQLGLDATLVKINERHGPFVWKDTYIFAIDIDKGTVIAHPIKPKLIGKKLVGIKDVNGKMFFAEFLKIAKSSGEGWVSYMWPKPGEKKPSPKKTYVYRVPGLSVALLAGIYE
ncbi:MAG: cache domain-containing protein [Deltaproteobacteria bacterium]|nr:cache domain-containing protein [Deltaproteobacteria bacterium]MBW2016405.1 cache domain-containing protein [Deltaproteobacteria bacterium]MBW2130303.1 cache domain-containing protein [Deltaproteobacteria bacterium]MBW2302337.1 cache domain-containing protein [Deltaproteobacteria bacterium]